MYSKYIYFIHSLITFNSVGGRSMYSMPNSNGTYSIKLKIIRQSKYLSMHDKKIIDALN